MQSTASSTHGARVTQISPVGAQFALRAAACREFSLGVPDAEDRAWVTTLLHIYHSCCNAQLAQRCHVLVLERAALPCRLPHS